MVAFKHKVKLNYLSGWLTQFYFYFYFLGKQSQEFPENLSKQVIDYFLPKLLKTYNIKFNQEFITTCNFKR